MNEKTKRQDKILEIIVESHVNKAEPISSRLVSKKLGLSSATVRNIMVDLEEEGYIFHPHTSAGRVPTDRGYRYYVDKLMGVEELSLDEEKNINNLFKSRINSLEGALEISSRVLSLVTNYASIILYPRLIESEFKRIELIPIEKDKILAIIINSAGVIKQSFLELDEEINLGELAKISRFLNEELMGLDLSEIEDYLKRKMYLEKDSFYHMFKRAMEIIDLSNFLKDEEIVFYDGAAHMLDYPEFRDVKTIRHLLETFEEKNNLVKVLSEDLNFDGVRIHIGKENYIDNFQDFTVVTASYKLKNHNAGSLGVIGPKRMSYPKVVSVLKYISNQLSKILSTF